MAHIAFFLPDLGGGGAERLTLVLAHEALARGHRVDIVLLRARGELMPLIPAGAGCVDLGVSRIRAGWAPLQRYLRRDRPDLVIAAMWPITVVALVAAIGLGARPRMLVADHCALSRQYAGARAMLRLTIALAYRLADGVIGVSQGVSRDIARLGLLPERRVATVYNPVPPACASGRAVTWPGPARRILAVGRLKAQKNHALLIRAFALLPPAREAVLAIVGEGEERAALERQVAAAGLESRVILPGFTTTPGDWFAGADLLVNSSDYEGLPLVLIEALHAGLPVVATDCPAGPAEVLDGGRWGHLVPVGDAGALAEAMARALDAAPSAAQRAARRKRAAEFAAGRALDGYLALARLA